MPEVAHSIFSSDGRLRIDVVRRPDGIFNLSYYRFVQENVPEYDFKWEGWMRLLDHWVSLTDTLERGIESAKEAMKSLEQTYNANVRKETDDE